MRDKWINTRRWINIMVIILLYCVYNEFHPFPFFFIYIYIYNRKNTKEKLKFQYSQFTDVSNRNLYGKRTNYRGGRVGVGNIGNTISFPIFPDGLFSKKSGSKKICCCEWRASINRFEDWQRAIEISRSKFIVLASTSPLYTDQNQLKKT